MISRLKEIAKRVAAVIATGIITLTALPAIPVHASGGVMNYHVYQNAKQVYDSVADTSWIYTTPDNSELFWVTKSNKASNKSVLRYRTLGWRLVISGSGYSQKCDLILDNTIKKPAGALGECENNGYYYILYTIDLKTVYSRMCAQNGDIAAKIYGSSTYHITAHPIMTKVPAGRNPDGSLTGENSNGTVNTSGFVCFMDEDGGYNALKKAASWSPASYTAFDDFHSGRNCDINTMKYNVRYKIVDGDGNAVKNIALSNGLKTNQGGGVVDSKGSAYSQNVKSYAPINTLNVSLTQPGYTLEKIWKKSGTNYAVGFGGQITSYAIGGNTTFVAKVTPITYYVEYYKDKMLIARQACVYDKDSTIMDGSSITWNGYTFKNWNSNKNGTGVIYTPNQVIKNLSDQQGGVVKLYAQKEPKEYEITLNPVGGSGGTDKVYEKYATKYTAKSEKTEKNPAKISTVTSPKKFGYDFLGYFTSGNGHGNKLTDGVNPTNAEVRKKNTNHTVNIKDETATMFDDTNPHIVYANYQPRTPLITFNKNGGEGGTNSVKATYAQNLPTSNLNSSALQAPTKEGWSFRGYYNGKKMLYNEAMGPIGKCDFENDITATAKWEDDIPPTATIVRSSDKWTNGNLTVTVYIQDKGSGLNPDKCSLTMDGKTVTWDKSSIEKGATAMVSKEFKCMDEGVHIFEVTATDMKGNQSTAVTTVYYDVTAPRGSATVTGPGISPDTTSTKLYNDNTAWTFEKGAVTDYKTN